MQLKQLFAEITDHHVAVAYYFEDHRHIHGIHHPGGADTIQYIIQTAGHAVKSDLELTGEAGSSTFSGKKSIKTQSCACIS